MSYHMAGIDIHKRVLMVVVVSVAEEVTDATGAAMEFECRRFGTGASERNHLVAWLQPHQVREVVMESTAQYWKPVWLDLEPHFEKLNLAQAQSNQAPKARKNDFRDAKRLARRLLAGELMLSFGPEPEQRTWRLMTRGRLQLVRERVRLQSQVECLLEAARIKLSSVISDLPGVSGRRILEALSKGQTDAAKLAALGDDRLKCTKEQLADALSRRAGAGPSATAETASGTIAVAGRADQSAQPDERDRAAEASAGGGPVGGSTRIWRGVRATNDRGSGGRCGGLRLGGRVRLLVRSMSGQRRERGRES